MKTLYLNFISGIKIEGFLLSLVVFCCCFLSFDVQAQTRYTADVEPATIRPVFRMNAECIDVSIIDDEVFCTTIVDPVCGCDGITYVNECVAQYSYGITDYKKGECACNVKLEVASRKLTCDGYDICIAIEGQAPFKVAVNGSSSTDANDNGVFCLSGLQGGTYVIKVKDANGCEESLDFDLPVVDYYIPSVVKHLTCYDSQDGAIKIEIDVDADLKFVWSGPNGYSATTQNIEDLTAGFYSVKVSYADGTCYGAMGFEVKQPNELKLEVEFDYPDCNQQPDGCVFVKGGTAPYKLFVFDWNSVATDTPNIVFTDGMPTVEGFELNENTLFDESPNNDLTKFCAKDILDGIYLLLVLDTNGCYVWKRVKVEAGKPLEVKIETKDLSCHGTDDGEICYKVSGGKAPYKAAIVPNTPIIPLEGDRNCFSGLDAGEYKLYITDANGCEFSTVVQIKQADELVIDFRQTSEACEGQVDGCLKVSGGTPGYKIWIFTCPEPAPVPAEVEPVFDADGIPAVDGMVRNDEIIFYPNTDDGFVACAEDIPAAIYYVLVVDENGCWKFRRILIEPAAGSIIIDGEVTPVSCHGDADGAIDIKVDGGIAPYIYSWSNGATTEDITGLTIGEYIVKVEDANGCKARKAFVVRQPTAIEIEFRITSEACDAQVDGCLQISGGTPDYRIWAYQCPSPIPVLPEPIFTAVDTPVIDGMVLTDALAFELNTNGDFIRCAKDIPAGVYYILVMDANHCWTLEKIEIPAPSGIRIESEVTCSNGQDGAIDIKVSGGDTNTYYFSWSNGETTEDLSGLAPGTYEVKVYTDNDFCTASMTFEVRECCDIILNCKYDFFGEYACVDPEGGTPEYTIVYTNLTTEDIVNSSDDPNCIFDLAPGIYYVKVTDANGCMADEIFIIEEHPCQAGEAIVDPKEITSGQSTVFTLVNYSGVSIQWQFMTEDTDWIDVPGGTTDVFVTPPIHVGDNKRIKVRAAVTCEDGTILYSTIDVFYVYVYTTNRVVANPVVEDAKLFDEPLPVFKPLDVKIFPTVSSGDVSIQFESDYQTPTRVHVIDLNGQVKQTLDAGQPTTGETRAIDMNGYRSGLYLITVESDGERVSKRVFISNEN